MNVADGLKRLKRSGSEMMNGAGEAVDHGGTAARSAPAALLAALPLALLIGVTVLALRRRNDAIATATEQAQAKRSAAAAQVKGAIGKVRAVRRKPRNLVRYYSIGLLISMIERDATRKILLTALKWMQKRA